MCSLSLTVHTVNHSHPFSEGKNAVWIRVVLALIEQQDRSTLPEKAMLRVLINMLP